MSSDFDDSDFDGSVEDTMSIGDDVEDDDGMDATFDDDMDDGPVGVRSQSLTPADLMSTQLEAIKEVNDVFEIPPQTARTLLQHFKWDKDRLLERYFGGDREGLFKEARCVDPTTLAVPKMDLGSEAECEICMVDIPRSELTGVSCGHEFCKECWIGYLSEKVNVQGQSTIACPAHECDILMDELTVTRLCVNEEELMKRYNFLASKAFVEGNKEIKWCPKPGCEFAIKISSGGGTGPAGCPVVCKCGHSFCFQCQNKAHVPVSCEMLKAWLKKCQDDSETANWINSNTKECPKCKITIEKNGGCNHMICHKCQADFCWVCLGPWEPHGSSWYNCSRFDEKESKQAQEAATKSRSSLQRYLFYFNRYANHENSLKLEAKLVVKVDAKMTEIQNGGSMSWIEVQFLKKAVTTLSQCRLALMHTYVFAFFLAKNNEAEIFESNQRDLEMACEELSGYLEGDLSKDPRQLKQQVQDKARYCEQRYRVMLEHVQEGRDRDAWAYREGDIPVLDNGSKQNFQ
eukprot:m.337641 g.337641  ORF g.337641 m.337641 type:complete len:517 (+) comp18191_c0_seq1:388-1938(+)